MKHSPNREMRASPREASRLCIIRGIDGEAEETAKERTRLLPLVRSFLSRLIWPLAAGIVLEHSLTDERLVDRLASEDLIRSTRRFALVSREAKVDQIRAFITHLA